jgi:hypothetical protein
LNADADADETLELLSRIGPILAGRPPQVQGAVLADLFATWLAGHFAETPEQTAELREVLLEQHLDLVRKLIPLNEAAGLRRARDLAS